jgi:hypothetical protein
MAGTPILFRTTVPTIDLVENLSPKYIVTESPQEFRVVQYPATSFSQSYINWNIISPSLTQYSRDISELRFQCISQSKAIILQE